MLKPIIAAYEELAVGIADEFSATHELQVLLRDFRDEVEKFYAKKSQIGETEGALLMNRFEAMFGMLKGNLEDLSIKLRRIQSSNNVQKYNMLRETANAAMFVKNGREGVNVDESKINLDPSFTGVHFVEYTFDRALGEIIDGKLLEDPGEYGLMSIIDNWTPNLTSYVDSVWQILNAVYTERMAKLTKALTNIKTEMEDLEKVHYRDAIGRMFKLLAHCENYCNWAMLPKINMYQFIQNSVKNFSIVNQAINFYLNDDNIGYTF